MNEGLLIWQLFNRGYPISEQLQKTALLTAFRQSHRYFDFFLTALDGELYRVARGIPVERIRIWVILV